MIDIKVDLLHWCRSFLIKKKSGGTARNEDIANKELAEELHKTIIKKNQEKKSPLTFYR